ncbi:hypothetical protein J2T56_003198 [Natronobacillus azotifigens]|uniref:Uncharacterized protein n=1 Tax=Natronobacillus azotifigens TaxID=472978 RepID=A0A9J6RG93_9BACI|nr:hypothetical protein [Natronobacillus azotifigens]MCZ0704624.1 hypothetical protein [Natronobacillus azotifigens]
MKNKQDIVPVHLSDAPAYPNKNQKSQTKPTVAFQCTKKETTYRVYNGVDKFILYTLLKELNE